MSTNNMKNPYGVYEPEYKLSEENETKAKDTMKELSKGRFLFSETLADWYISILKGIARGISSLAKAKKVPCEADVPNEVEEDYFQWSNIEDKYLHYTKEHLREEFERISLNADELVSLKYGDAIVPKFEILKKFWENIVKQVHFCIWAQLYASSFEKIKAFYPRLTDEQKKCESWNDIEYTLFTSCGEINDSKIINLSSLFDIIHPVLGDLVYNKQNEKFIFDNKTKNVLVNFKGDNAEISWSEEFVANFTVDWQKFDEELATKISLDMNEWKYFGAYDESIWRFAKDVNEFYREVIFQPLERVQPEVPTIDEKLYELEGNNPPKEISKENLPKNLATLTLATIVSAVKSDHSSVKKGKTNYALSLSQLKEMGLVSSDTESILIVDSGYVLTDDLSHLFGNMELKDIFPGEPYVYISGKAFDKLLNR